MYVYMYSSFNFSFHTAIQFVLSDDFTHLKPDDRQQLLHVRGRERERESFKSLSINNRKVLHHVLSQHTSKLYLITVTTGYKLVILISAHLILNNARQIESEEVTLRRVIGMKKDNYYLDGKHVT